MSEKILVCAAWPYANGPLHLGHLAGAYLPADIFARYHRIKGNEVLMVSGSDMHGTPITIQAEQRGISPEELAFQFHNQFRECWKKMGITFDLYTHTHTDNHREVTQEIFRTLLDKGYIFPGKMPLLFCAHCQRVLPDRYVEGDCPFCGFDRARGDQCDRCGKPLNTVELVNPRCMLCGARPEAREVEHLFLRLSAFEKELYEWVKQQTHWKPNALNFTLRFLEEGLKDRAITRDLKWGIPVPLPGYEDKRIYVWFEAVIGYLSATKEWASSTGRKDGWEKFWKSDARSFYFIGKDNIPFHTLIWPAMLMGYGGLNLPYNVPANEFLTIEGSKLSTSRNWAVWVLDCLERYDADPLRYILSINMPENADTDFSWREFYRRNNDELVATYGNLVHRVLTFTYRNFNGEIPPGNPEDSVSGALVAKAEATLTSVDRLLSRCYFREAIKQAMALAQQANRYLDDKAPWKRIKEDRQDCASSLLTAIKVISALRTLFYPFLPFSSEKLHKMLGFSGTVESDGWRMNIIKPGQKLMEPQPLFKKLEESIVEEELSKLGKKV